MENHHVKINSGKLFQWVFHLVLWTIWIGLPIVNAGENIRVRTYLIWLIPVSLTNIPLFLLNTELLIPRILRGKGVSRYLLSLIILTAVFALIQYFMKEWMIPTDIRFGRNSVFWAVVPPSFVTAISTGYGFIVYLINQEKAQQEQQQERLKSELSFLRSQISPHFIFNILNSIVYLIRSNAAQAESVTIKLSELIRHMLYTSEKEQIPLEKEIGYLENYISLQRIRFEEDVEIKLEIIGNPGSNYIEPMILIPFVENAFKHGVGLLNDAIIDIRIEIENEKFSFHVRNKIAPELREEKDFSSGIGLKNVKRRLELLYPFTHKLDIQEKDNWFAVKLVLKLPMEGKRRIKDQLTPETYETPLHSR
jgi:two-component system LytT family sensor kinase